MMSMYEPTSLAKLSRKGAQMHEDAVRGMSGLKVSPRGGAQDSLGGSSSTVGRRSSSHFREIPANVIPENADGSDEQDSSEEEKKQSETAPAQQANGSNLTTGVL